MTSAAVTIDGAAALGASVAAAGAELGDLTAAGERAGELVLGAARIPRRTGRLASTVHVVGSPAGFELVAGGTAAPYAPYVHAANPFLTRPLTARESDVVDLYLGAVTDAVDTITGA